MNGAILSLFLIFALQSTGLAVDPYAYAKTPLYRYWNGAVSDHFYTPNPYEIGTTTHGQVGRHGYVSEGVQSYMLFKYGFYGSVPLYRYYRPGIHDHFYTTNWREIGTYTHGKVGRYGYVSEGLVGYCMPWNKPGTVPLYRYWKASVSDHFYTTNINEIGTAHPGAVGKHGYKSEGIECYVPPYY